MKVGIFPSSISHESLTNTDGHRVRSLPSERATLSESGLATGGLTEDGRAAGADDNCLSVREDGGDCEASGAFHIHEKRSRSWHEGLLRRFMVRHFQVAG